MSQRPSNVQWAQALIQGLISGGVAHAVLSPGSRHTPLVLAMHQAAEGGQLHIHDVLDERSAAFFALGIARISGGPVIVSCTSGSAGAHYLPAIIEASHDRLPLIALTADRPPELQGIGAPQTTEQAAFYGAHVRFFADAGLPESATATPQALAKQALEAALGGDPGPVHLNLPFKKPLWDGDLSAPAAAHPFEVSTEPPLDLEAITAAVTQIKRSKRGLLVVGPGDLGERGLSRAHAAKRLAVLVGRLADHLGWPLLVDGASYVRGEFGLPGALYVGDTLSRSEGIRNALKPDLVLRIGQIPTSTPLRKMLANCGHECTLLLDVSGRMQDPDKVGATVLSGDTFTVLETLIAQLADVSASEHATWGARWSAMARAVEGEQAAMHADSRLWSGACARTLAETLPKGGLIHLASSLAVRAFDAFGGATSAEVQLTSNRGVNGIDGTMATAFGQARSWPRPVAVLLGDLAFLHDLGTLATQGATWDGPPLVFLVLDNQGGGIFDHLPIAAHSGAFEPHFATPPNVDIAAIASPLVSTCVSLSEAAMLRPALRDGFTRPGVSVIHARFSRDSDLEAHRLYWSRGVAAAEAVIA